jgi:hypothetical protein
MEIILKRSLSSSSVLSKSSELMLLAEVGVLTSPNGDPSVVSEKLLVNGDIASEDEVVASEQSPPHPPQPLPQSPSAAKGDEDDEESTPQKRSHMPELDLCAQLAF